MKLSDEWRTPDWLFNQLNAEFNFDIDLCATKENKKCLWWCEDYLNIPLCELNYIISSAFMNPPYSNPKLFIEKAWEDSKYCKIVCLVKCDPSTRWWATFWEYYDEYMQCNQCRKVQIGKIIRCTSYARNAEPTKITGERFCMYCSLGYESKLMSYSGPKPGCEVRFFPKRIKFDPPEGLSGKSGPTFPVALVIMDRRGL